MVRLLMVLAAGFTALAGPSVRAATPLDELIKPEVNASACFTRIYDAAHLRAHPRQKTTAMTAGMKYEPLPGGAPGIGLAGRLRFPKGRQS